MKNAYIAMVIAVWLLLPGQTKADELQDRLKTAVEAYRDTVKPEHADISLRRARIIIDDAVKKSNPSEVVRTTNIGEWIIRNQPSEDVDPVLRKSLVDSLSGAFKKVMEKNTVYASAMTPIDITAAELQLRVVQAIEDVVPGPSQAEIDKMAKEAGERLAREVAEVRLKRRVQDYKRLMGLQ